MPSHQFMNKPVGGRLSVFSARGSLVGGAHAELGEDHFVLRVYLRQPDMITNYLYEVSHRQGGKLTESWCDREGYASKDALTRAIREHRLQAGEGEAGGLLDRLRESVIQHVAEFKEPADEWSVLSVRSESSSKW